MKTLSNLGKGSYSSMRSIESAFECCMNARAFEILVMV